MFHLQTRTSRSTPWRFLSSSPETLEGRQTLQKHRCYWQHLNGQGINTRIVSDYQLYMEQTPERPAGALVTALALLLMGWAFVVLLAVVR